jgi:outer membrane protein OmpA-like peptidoglycan-associated protein/tetratricopeptide (TPR) repeat protein
MRLLLLIATMSSLSLTAVAQWFDAEKVNKKAMTVYLQGMDAAEADRYPDAIKKMDEAIKLDPRFVDAWLSRAGLNAHIRQYPQAVRDFQTAIQLDSIYCHTYFLPYSIALAGNGKFKEALQAVDHFLTFPKLNSQSIRAANYRRNTYAFAQDLDSSRFPNNAYSFSPQNMGPNVNSLESEYYPSLTIDGKTLVFTRRVENDEDFYETHWDGTTWSKATALPGKVNTNLNEGAQHISQDGRWLIFTGCNYPEGQGSCDLYISYRTNQGWSEAENMGAIVNSDFWESSPALSPDKRELFFSSNLPGGFGGKDIWVVRRNPKGGWGRPENLGAIINTSSDESCAFLYGDNRTLFFNSDGHPGLGGTDLFYSRRTDSGWQQPVNLGYPINTIDDEGSLIVASDGKTAFYASDRSDSYGGLDLYQFELPKGLRPPALQWVEGRVTDAKTQQGLPSSVELTSLRSGQLISKLQTDEDGYYLTTLPEGDDYAFTVNRKGYLFFSERYDLISSDSNRVFTVDIPLKPIEVGAAIVLKNIFFDTRKAELQAASTNELDRVIQLLEDNPGVRIEILGHTDNVGKPTDNQLLSENRAKAVVEYLLKSKKIDRQRLSARGMGERSPIADNTTETGRAKNRRTELKILRVQ